MKYSNQITINFDITRKLLHLSIPISISAICGMIVDLTLTRLVGDANPQNYYILSLYLPISYILIAVLESFRANMLHLSASNLNAHNSTNFVVSSVLLIIYGLIISLLLFIVFKLFASNLFTILKISSENKALFDGFVTVMLLLFWFRYISYILVSTLYGINKSYLAMIIAIGSGLLSITLTYFLIKYVHPSIYGQAYALSIGSIIVSIIMFYLLKTNKMLVKINPSQIVINFLPYMWQCIRFSAPIFISYIVILLSLFAYNIITANFGVNVVAGFGIAYRIQTLIILPAIALGIATGILINQKKSSSSNLQLNNILNISIATSIVLYAIIAFVTFIFCDNIAKLVVPDNSINQHTIQYLHIVAPTYIGTGPLLVLLITMEQVGLSLRSFFFNLFYFGTIIVVGGLMSIALYNITYLYMTIATINLFSLMLLIYLCFIRHKRIIPELNCPSQIL